MNPRIRNIQYNNNTPNAVRTNCFICYNRIRYNRSVWVILYFSFNTLVKKEIEKIYTSSVHQGVDMGSNQSPRDNYSFNLRVN